MSDQQPTPPETIDLPKEVPYLNSIRIVVYNVNFLSPEGRLALYNDLGMMFMQRVSDDVATFEVLINGITGYQAFWYLSHTLKQMAQRFPIVHFQVSLAHIPEEGAAGV